MSTPRTEEYLESIFKLQQVKFPVSISRLAENLRLSAASASEMAKKLKEMKLVSTEGKKVYLTKKGNREAATVVRRHRLLERFLMDILGLSWEEVHEEACELEHAISSKVEKKLAGVLKNPKTCPHGHPIPDTKGNLAKEIGSPLALAPEGKEVVIMGVPEENVQGLKYLAKLGLKPQTKLKIVEKAPFKGPLLIKIGKFQHPLDRELASQILVKTV